MADRPGANGPSSVVAVAAGVSQFAGLEPEDRDAAHALVDAEIARRVARERFGTGRGGTGERSTSVDDDGTLIEFGPDGTARLLRAPSS